MRERLKATRKAKGVTLDFLAERLGISRPQMSRIETGQRKLTVEMLEEIAKHLGSTPGELLDFPLFDQDVDLLVTVFQDLDPARQEMVLQMIRALKIEQPANPSE